MNKWEKETVVGVYKKTVMRNVKTSYTVAEIEKEKQRITIAGVFIPVPIGTKIKAEGIWEQNKWGWSLSKAKVDIVSNTRESTIDYLSHCQGIGEVTAGAVADKIGDALYKTPDSPFVRMSLMQIKGITAEKADSVIEFVKQTKAERELFNFLAIHGGTYSSSLRIFKQYGINSLQQLMENPYKVGNDGGLTFAVCDQIAIRCGISVYSQLRLDAGIKQTLKMGAQSGHCYLDYAQLHEQCRKLLNSPALGWDENIGTPLISSALRQTSVNMVWDQDRLYSKYMYHYEVNCANQVKRLLQSAQRNHADVNALCKFAEEQIGVEYAPQQREAFGLLNAGGIVIVTGGPGTGKTTVINGLLTAYEQLYPNNIIKLCAPTGRASQRMKEATGREAITIHRLLEYQPFGDDVTYKDANNPIEADLIVVDESSMLSIDIAEILFSAIKSGTMVMLVGDVDQLPCVGAGNVLHDLIHCGVVPKVQLTKTYRQAETSLIIKNAKQINNGYDILKTGDDFEVVSGQEDKLPELVLDEVGKYNVTVNPFDMQVLTPARRKGESGAVALNKQLQSLLNPTGISMRYGDTIFRVGDKVMTIRNNYAVGYYNGDVGIIKSVSDDSLTIDIDGNILEITQELLDDVVLAYATTIHKSQGSEYKTAIIVLPSEPKSMLQRNLLYTAVTRAKEKCIIISGENTISKAVKRCDAVKRNTYLGERVCE